MFKPSRLGFQFSSCCLIKNNSNKYYSILSGRCFRKVLDKCTVLGKTRKNNSVDKRNQSSMLIASDKRNRAPKLNYIQPEIGAIDLFCYCAQLKRAHNLSKWSTCNYFGQFLWPSAFLLFELLVAHCWLRI